MVLIRNVTIICCAILLLLSKTSFARAEADSLTGSETRWSPLLVFAFFLVITFAGAFRQGFVDTGTYKHLYQQAGTDFSGALDDTLPIEHGFSLFMILLNRVNPDPQFFVAITALITFSIDIYVLWKYSRDLPFALYLYLVSSYMGSMNGIRQAMAASILSLALIWVIDRKPIPYMILVLLLSSVHASVLVMIPLYFIMSGRRLNRGIWLFAAAIVLSFLFPEDAKRFLGVILEDSAYAEYLENESKMGLTRLAVVAVPLVLTLIYSYMTRNLEYPGKRMTDVLINMHILDFGFCVLGLKMVYFARLSMYFSMVLPLLLPITIDGIFDGRSAKTVRAAAIVLYMIFFIYQILAYQSYGYMSAFHLIF